MDYFVSYNWFSDKQTGSGSIKITFSGEINDYQDITIIKEHIDNITQDDHGNKIRCVIMNYIPLTKRDKDETT